MDELFGLMDAVVHAGEEDRLAVEAGRLDLLLRRHDDAVAVGDLIFRQEILCAVGAVGLDFDGHAHLGTGLVQGFSGHVGVGDAVDTGGDGQHTAARLLDLLVGEALVAELGLFLRVDGGEEVFRGLGGAQLLHEVLVHEHLHHTGQHIHVEAAVLGGCDGKQQVGLAVVLGIVLHRGLEAEGRQTGPGHTVALGVGDGDAVIHIGRALVLAGVKALFVGFLVSDVAVGRLQLHQTVDDLAAVLLGFVQRDGLCREQFRDSHSVSPLLIVSVLALSVIASQCHLSQRERLELCRYVLGSPFEERLPPVGGRCRASDKKGSLARSA